MVHSADTVTAAIARNLRAERGRRGLSLEQLSARAGVSKGGLVALEAGRTNPTVSTLYRVAEALGIAVAELVAVGDATPWRVVTRDDAAVAWEGARGGTGRLLVGATATGHVEVWAWTLQPGDVCDGTVDPTGTFEVLTVASGVLTVDVAGDEVHVRAGEALRMASDRPHRYLNATDGPVEFQMVITQPRPERT